MFACDVCGEDVGFLVECPVVGAFITELRIRTVFDVMWWWCGGCARELRWEFGTDLCGGCFQNLVTFRHEGVERTAFDPGSVCEHSDSEFRQLMH